MFAKPINLVLVYVVTIFNILFLLFPLIAAAVPLMSFSRNGVEIDYNTFQKMKLSFILVGFVVSALMLIYMFFDFLFGFSVRSSLKNCVRYEKVKDYDFLSDIFDQVKKKFGTKSAKLYIKNSDEINAYAVSSLGSRTIVLTRGIINHYLVNCPDPKMFLYALRSVMGHEMSHLINKDFLPTFLIIINQRITNFVSGVMHFGFSIVVKTVSMIPYGGRTTANSMSIGYTVLNFVTNSFNRFVVYNIYEFLRRIVSRSIEYRCDRQSAKAFGGKNMALALSMLGESGYFTLFSTHPKTKARINKVQNIESEDAVIQPGFFDSLANYFSMMFLVVVCLYFAKEASADVLFRDFIRNHEMLYRKALGIWHLLNQIY